MNLYGYVNDNPINFVDPRGLLGGGFIVSGSAEAGVVAGGQERQFQLGQE